MTLTEFNAWFAGFTEAMDGPPDAKAWKRICEQAKSITPDPVPFPIVWPQYPPPPVYPYYPPLYSPWVSVRMSINDFPSQMIATGVGQQQLNNGTVDAILIN